MSLSPRLLAPGLIVLIAAVSSGAEIPKPPAIRAEKNNVAKMRSGAPGFRVKDDPRYMQDIRTVAQWLAYTIATPPYNGEPVPREDRTPAFIDRSMTALMTEAESLCNLQPAASSGGKLAVEQVEFGIEFGKAIGQEARLVWSNSARPIERVNAVRLMSVAAKMPAPDLIDPFVEIIGNDRVSDAEKLYAFQGMRNLLEQSELVDPNRHVTRDLNKLGQAAQALSDYITRKRDPRDNQEKAVIEFVRRHAVIALAQFKDGVIRRPNKDVVYRPAWTLMRVIGGDPNVTPPFTTVEKVEAAIGFCQQRIDPEMNLDVATYMIAVAPVPTAATPLIGGLVEFARVANEDVQRAASEGTLPSYHWKILAARQSSALAVWRETAKAIPAARGPTAITGIANTGIQLLDRIEKGGGGAATGAEVAAVNTWAGNNPPKAWSENPPRDALLFQDDPTSIVPFAVRATLKTDPKKGPAAPPK